MVKKERARGVQGDLQREWTYAMKDTRESSQQQQQQQQQRCKELIGLCEGDLTRHDHSNTHSSTVQKRFTGPQVSPCKVCRKSSPVSNSSRGILRRSQVSSQVFSSSPLGGICSDNLTREGSRRHPKQMSEIPQHVPPEVEEQQIYSEFQPVGYFKIHATTTALFFVTC
ncbi:hypothetical protein WMY93_002368 [Mugilogobius chulae]|uniref:Uncharacterized protein n=1 Tax=Mugilogobius chulae TaxID=88201 RepID=A0AAW0Q4A0_9GOBI